jgi:hypothetical protein
MSDSKKDTWLNYLALTSVILAVCATLSTFKGGGFSTRSVLSQTQISDQWAFYQAKSLKGYLYEIQKEELELDTATFSSTVAPLMRDEYRKRIEAYGANIERYNAEKTKISEDARKLEKVRDDAMHHSQTFGMAVIFLQIAILLSSIAALMKKKPVWVLGMATGLIGIYYFLNGFLLFA